MSKLAEQIPPYDTEAENSILSAIIFDPATADIALTSISEEDLYLPRSRVIFGHCRKMWEIGTRIDELTLSVELNRTGSLGAIGGREELGRIVMQGNAANVEDYCAIVREYAERRKLLQLSTWLLEHAKHNNLDECMEKATNELDGLMARRCGVSDSPEDLHKIAEPLAKEVLTQPEREYWGLQCGVGDGEIDRLVGGFEAPKYCVVSGRASMGKSTLALHIAMGIRKKQPEAGCPLIISTELPKKLIGRAALGSAAGVHTEGLLKRNLGEGQKEAVANVIRNKTLEGVKVVYMAAPTVSQIKAVAQQHQRKFGLPLLVIDLADKIRSEGRDEYTQLSNTSRSISTLKKDLHTVVLATVQISRAALQQDNKRPDVEFLKGTGSWEQDADMILLLHRPSYYKKDGTTPDGRTEIICGKDNVCNRRGDSVWIEYKKGWGRYTKCENSGN
jgi:replicative DNA helicase